MNAGKNVVFARPESLRDVDTHYCAGCGHGVAHRLIAEVVDELGVRERTIGIAPVGCAVLAYEYLNFDFIEAAHGRAPAIATGIKRSVPESVVISYQGDGDLAAIGTAEIIHAANRGECFTTVFVNNAVYGMTGGQMAPTTIPGQRTATTPKGRQIAEDGMPLRVAELLSQLPGVVFSARGALASPKHIREAKMLLRQALEIQERRQGFAIVELLSACPTYWGMKPQQACAWILSDMLHVFPLGVFKEPGING